MSAKQHPTSMTARASNLAVSKTPIRCLPGSSTFRAAHRTIVTVLTPNFFNPCHELLLAKFQSNLIGPWIPVTLLSSARDPRTSPRTAPAIFLSLANASSASLFSFVSASSSSPFSFVSVSTASFLSLLQYSTHIFLVKIFLVIIQSGSKVNILCATWLPKYAHVGGKKMNGIATIFLPFVLTLTPYDYFHLSSLLNSNVPSPP